MDLMENNRELLDTNIFFLSRSTNEICSKLGIRFYDWPGVNKTKIFFIIWPIRAIIENK